MNKVKYLSLLISSELSLKEAMQRLSETAEKILLVVDGKRKLTGTVTDGDIRRGLLKGLKFGDRVDQVMSLEFIWLAFDIHDLEGEAKKLMVQHKIEQIPVLDDNGIVKNIILWTDIFESGFVKKADYTNPVVIMAGGKGTRMDPFTRVLPKPLIPIGDKPIIEIIMQRFNKDGFSNFILSLNYKKEYIKTYLKEISLPYNIEWVEEEEYLGTAGSLSLMKNMIKNTFFVTNCDSLVEVDFYDVFKWHKEHNVSMTVVGCHREVKVPFGVLDLHDGRLKKILEKPIYDVTINTGLYIMEPNVIDMIQKGTSIDMNVLIERLSKKNDVTVYPIHYGWLDIGQWDEYKNNLKKLESL